MFFSRPRFRRFGSFWFWFGFGLGWQVALELTVVYGGGTSLVVGTDGASWKGLDATPMFNPSKSMASPAYAQPLEDMDATSAAYAAAGRGWAWRDGWANGTTAAFDDSLRVGAGEGAGGLRLRPAREADAAARADGGRGPGQDRRAQPDALLLRHGLGDDAVRGRRLELPSAVLRSAAAAAGLNAGSEPARKPPRCRSS